MKKWIAGVLAGLLLGTAGTSVAATQYGGWRNVNTKIRCHTKRDSHSCYLRDGYVGDLSYSVYISDCSVAVWQDRGGRDLAEVFDRWQPKCR